MDDKNKCLVCNDSAVGIHNKCRSCRACAAFFKRIILHKTPLICKYGTGKCVINYLQKNQCKSCRFEKCKRVGMVLKEKFTNNIKQNEDEVRKNLQFLSFGNLIEKGMLSTEFINVPIDIKFRDVKIDIDFTNLMNSIRQIFLKRKKFSGHYNNIKLVCHLKEAFKAIKKFNNTMNLKTLFIMSRLNLSCFDKNIRFLGKCLILTAEMLMEIPQFYFLPFNAKLQIFKSFWHIWWFLWTIYKPLELLNFNNTTAGILLDESNIFTILNYEFCDSTLPDCQSKAYIYYFSDFYKFMHKHIIMPIKRINMTPIEVAYLLMLSLWSPRDDDSIPSQYENLGIEILIEAGNELHQYYSKNIPNTSFIYRTTEITKIYGNIKKTYGILYNATIIARLWNFIHYNIFETELAPSGLF